MIELAAIATSFEHHQSTPSTTWVVTHNLKRKPIVDVYIYVAGEQTRVLPSITYDDLSTCTISFTDPQSGFAAFI